MIHRSLHPLLRYLRHLHPGCADKEDADDALLLRRFLADRDEDAFLTLLHRHGPLVWGLCVRRLGETADAEDAFQATFLVLLRKPPSLAGSHSLGPWLYGVAWRTTCKSRRQLLLRAGRERPLPEQLADSAAGQEQEQVWLDVRPVIDEEVNRLPDKYRQAVLLCYLQGRSTEEAARLLGCARGTVFSRLARGRDLLRQRLARRGLNISAGALAGVLTTYCATRGTVQAALVQATLHLGLSLAGKTAGQALSPTVINLAEGALRSMLLSKIKRIVVVLLVLGIAGSGAGFLAHHSAEGQPAPQPNGNAPPAAAAKDQDRTTAAKADPSRAARDEAIRKQQMLKMLEEKRFRALPLDRKLKQTVHFKGFDDPKTTLAEALDALARTYDLTWIRNEKALRASHLKEVGKAEIAQPPIPEMTVPLKVVLQTIIDRATKPRDRDELILLLRSSDTIEITTRTSFLKEMGRAEGPLLPLVWEDIQETSVREALENVAQSSGYSVIVDPQVEDKVQVKANGRLKNVPTDTAVRLLAAMADVSVVQMDNAFFLTTPDKAKQLRQEQSLVGQPAAARR